MSKLGIRTIASMCARTQRSKFVPAIALLSFSLIPSLSLGAIYKCTAQDGSITYTDDPCAADAKTQTIDPSKPQSPIESSLILNNSSALLDEKSQSDPEILADLCAADEFSVWLKAQRDYLPEREVRSAKFIRLSKLCRSALNLSNVATTVLESPLQR